MKSYLYSTSTTIIPFYQTTLTGEMKKAIINHLNSIDWTCSLHQSYGSEKCLKVHFKKLFIFQHYLTKRNGKTFAQWVLCTETDRSEKTKEPMHLQFLHPYSNPFTHNIPNHLQDPTTSVPPLDLPSRIPCTDSMLLPQSLRPEPIPLPLSTGQSLR